MPPRTDGAAVTLPHSDALLHRTALQLHRLTIQRDAIDHQIDKHVATLRTGLLERRTTRLDLDGTALTPERLRIVRTGNDISVSQLGRHHEVMRHAEAPRR